MIPITKNFLIRPDKLDYTQDPLLKALKDLKTLKNKHKFKGSIYRNGTIAELKTLYKNKCGYCESNTSAGAELRVDHYRPKDKVKEDSTHTGYFWLGYEWSNLVLACEKCNRSKSNKFPLGTNSVRITSPPLISGTSDYDMGQFLITHNSHDLEIPLIINPEKDSDLKLWFIFLPSGKIVGLNNKAKKTIEVCKLNREPLLIARKKIINIYQRRVRKILCEYRRTNDTPILKAKMKDLFDEIKELSKPRNSYSRLGFFLFLKFDLFISDFMKFKSQALLKKLFIDYKNGTL